MKAKTICIAASAAMLFVFTSCLEEKDGVETVYTETVHLSADWSKRSGESALPESYFVRIGTRGATFTDPAGGDFPIPIPTGKHSVNIYNYPANVSIEHKSLQRTASVTELTGANAGYLHTAPGWLFAWSGTSDVQRGAGNTIEAEMVPLMRDLEITVTNSQDNVADLFSSIKSAELNGVAKSVDLDTYLPFGLPYKVKTPFTASGKSFKSTVRLLGLIEQYQYLEATIVLKDGTSEQTLVFEVADALSTFGENKLTPFPLVIRLNSFDEVTGEVTGWNVTTGYEVE